jgi:hypothetical protein
VSTSTSGAEADGPAMDVAISGDGLVIAWTSVAKNLIDGDLEATAFEDVFVREAGVVSRASTAPSGGAGNGASRDPALSADGRFLAFVSAATNLNVAVEHYGKIDVYLRDRQIGAVTRINHDLDGTTTQADCSAPSISADGQRIAFASTALYPGFENDYVNGYVYTRSTGAFTFVGESLVGSAPNGGTGYGVTLAANGGVVVFASSATNLFPGDAGGFIDIFLLSLD